MAEQHPERPASEPPATPAAGGFVDLRDDFLSRVVKGKSFVDVGGLWGTVNERVSVAHRCGAAELTMLDTTAEGAELWRMFDQRMAELGIAGYQCRVADVGTVKGLRYEVVHCSGVLYHHPHPLQMLCALRAMTGQALVLTTAVCREVIENERGRFELPPSGVLFVPALSDQERQVIGLYWRERGVEAHGITRPVRFDPADFGPWWWLPTVRAFRHMAEACGFEVLDGGPIWNDDAYTLLLQPLE